MTSEELFISGGPLTDVEIGARGLREIVQNVRTILATRRGSLFLDRHFGVSQTFLDAPSTVARARLVGEVVTEVERQEPRVKVTRVEFTSSSASDAMDGIWYPCVWIRLRDGVLL